MVIGAAILAFLAVCDAFITAAVINTQIEWIRAGIYTVVAACLPIAVRYQWLAAGVFMVFTLAVHSVFEPTGTIIMVAVMLSFIQALRAPLLKSLTIYLILLVWGFAFSYLLLESLAFGFSFLLLASAAWLSGIAAHLLMREVGKSRRKVIELEEAQERVRQRERDNIARDLHDVVAHQLTLISMVSGTRQRTEDVEKLQAGMVEIREVSQEALVELRNMLNVLRQEKSTDTESRRADLENTDGGQRTLEDHVASVENRLAELGFSVTGERDFPRAHDVAASTVISASRILLEASTNIIKYAEPRSEVTLTIRTEGPWLHLDVDSRMCPNRIRKNTKEASYSSGEGLLSMRERALLLGGNLTAGPVGETWSVQCVLPLQVAEQTEN